MDGPQPARGGGLIRDQSTAALQWDGSGWKMWLEAVGLDHHGAIAEAARRLGISREHMSRLLSGKALSSEPLEGLAAIMSKVPPRRREVPSLDAPLAGLRNEGLLPCRSWLGARPDAVDIAR